MRIKFNISKEKNEKVKPTFKDNQEHCLLCNEPIPEGRQICYGCEREYKYV